MDIKEYNKQYYQDNKDRILERIHRKNHEKVYCKICDCYVKQFSLSRHYKTMKHKLKKELYLLKRIKYKDCDVSNAPNL